MTLTCYKLELSRILHDFPDLGANTG